MMAGDGDDDVDIKSITIYSQSVKDELRAGDILIVNEVMCTIKQITDANSVVVMHANGDTADLSANFGAILKAYQGVPHQTHPAPRRIQ